MKKFLIFLRVSAKKKISVEKKSDEKTPSLALSVLKNYRRQGIANDLMKNLQKNFRKMCFPKKA